MSRYLLLTSLLLISHSTTHGHASRIISHIVGDADLRRYCSFELHGYLYNLCPLIDKTLLVRGGGVGRSENKDQGEGSSSGRRFYEVALGGSSQWSQADVLSKSTNSQCNEDTVVCMLDLDMTYTEESNVPMRSELVRRPARAIPIASSAKSSRKYSDAKSPISVKLEETEGETSPPPLVLSLHGGSWLKRPQSAEIAISCAQTEDLHFIGEESGIHRFAWSTPHGCPTRLPRNVQLETTLSVAQEQGNDTTEDPEAPTEGEGDQALLPSDNGKMRRWIATFVIFSFACFIGGFFLLSSRARHLTSEKLMGVAHTVTPFMAQAALKLHPILISITTLTSKSLGRLGARFRQGDSQLVRWAQEDMSLMDAEDVMVNGEGAAGDQSGWNTDGLDEYIPLANSSKFGRSRRVRSYGTTPEVETFAERGVMTGLGKYLHK